MNVSQLAAASAHWKAGQLLDARPPMSAFPQFALQLLQGDSAVKDTTTKLVSAIDGV